MMALRSSSLDGIIFLKYRANFAPYIRLVKGKEDEELGDRISLSHDE